MRAKISKSSVARYLKESNQPRGKQDKKSNMGRPKILSARDVWRLRRSIVLLQKNNANFTVKELTRFSGLQDSSASYATFCREILKAGFKFLNSRKGVLSDCDCAKHYRFAKKCSKILKKNNRTYAMQAFRFIWMEFPSYLSENQTMMLLSLKERFGAKDRKGCS